jgi:glycosyltransferase involved in cell wall biosynthesis
VLEVCPEADLKVIGGPAYTLGRIESLGDRHDVAQQLAQADIFAYAPWPHEGTRDLVVLEAMASGLACVVSDVPCMRESVEHERTGLLTPFGEVRAFAESIVRLVKDGELREALGERAVAVAQRQLDMRQRCDLYEAVYSQALAETQPVGQATELKPCVACG